MEDVILLKTIDFKLLLFGYYSIAAHFGSPESQILKWRHKLLSHLQPLPLHFQHFPWKQSRVNVSQT